MKAMSVPVKLPDGRTVWWVTLTPVAETELEKLEREHPEASFEELVKMLGEKRN